MVASSLRRCPTTGSAPSSPRVYGCCGRAYSSSTGACSTTSPEYMTTTRSAMPATTPRSWLTQTTAVPRRSCRSCTRSRICACVVTSSAVVGSSAMSTAGSRLSPIAIMTRWRMPPENSCGWSSSRGLRVADADQRQQLGRPLARLARAHAGRSSSPSVSCRPIVSTGLSDVIGSWKTMPTSRPRSWRSRSGPAPSTSSPRSRTLPSTRAAGGSRPEHGQHRHALAAARLADDRERLAGATSRSTPATTCGPAAPAAERHPQVAHRTAPALAHRPPASIGRALPRVERVAQRVADDVERTAPSGRSRCPGRRPSTTPARRSRGPRAASGPTTGRAAARRGRGTTAPPPTGSRTPGSATSAR